MKSLFTMITSILLLASCVSVQRFEEKQAELDACRQLAQQDAQDLDSCRQKYDRVLATSQSLEQRAADLRRSLQDEVRSRDVEIETLKGKLTVRVLDRILFKTGSAQILPEGEAVLKKLGTVLATTQDYIRVEGHTDIVPIGERLKAKYYSNWELSAARAASVVRFFEDGHKIDPLRLEAVGFSKYRPVATGTTPAELQRNRRVEIVLSEALARPDTDKPVKSRLNLFEVN